MLRARAMRVADLDAAFDLQCKAHAHDYHEPRAALASRFKHGSASCFVADQGARLAAYVFAHPWRGAAPALHRPLARVAVPDHLFLHDLAVAPDARGSGAGRVLVDAVTQAARALGLSEVRLVAIAGADAFWLRHGWKPVATELDRSYGVGSRLMVRAVDAAPALRLRD
ncbi:GNAT family N-acetyltransferase [Niveibacterium sp. SC-1]|uniref:GNAT family N-acetyltransferase n=1 Tax=Niveibacterium sp. SC-1 TaxID=3135646 RepID=UPI00311E2764